MKSTKTKKCTLSQSDLNLLTRITSKESLKLPTFIFAGAGAALSDSYSSELKLPTAFQLREELLRAHYGRNDDTKNLNDFKSDFGISDPSPDQVWQALIRVPAKLQNYIERLGDLFSHKKPIPPSYYLLSRWFYTERANVGGFATTNFDLQLPAAFRATASLFSLKIDTEYAFAQVPQDYTYLTKSKTEYSKVIQQLHGSLERPWSIVAGAKRNVNAISNLLYEYDHKEGTASLELIRRVLDVLDSNDSAATPVKFPPYEYLREAIARCQRIIFIGYSFKDKELLKSLEEAINSTTEIIIVNPNSPNRKSAAFLEKANHTTLTSEVFLNHYVDRIKNCDLRFILPAGERSVLRDGPRFIPGHSNGRNISRRTAFINGVDFLDPIYGKIQFSKEVERHVVGVIDTGEVQRLRQIRQLSFVNLKYHGAIHDRFSHSVGVAHLGDKVYENIARCLDGQLEPDARSAFVIAALIHDIGHGPYGHTMDLVRRELGDTKGHEDDTMSIYEQMFNPEKSFADLDIALNSISINRDILRSILSGKHILSKVIANSGCDIDRLDFVMRDAAVTLASVVDHTSSDVRDLKKLTANYRRLLDGMKICKNSNSMCIAYDLEVKPILESFARLYCKLYDRVYYGRQNIAARTMLSRAVVEVVRSRKVELSDIKPMTDIELLAALEDFEHPKVRELAYLVKYRRLYPMIRDVRLTRAQEEIMLGDASDQSIVEKIGKISFKDGMLIARLPSKKIGCRFVTESIGLDGDAFFKMTPSEPEVMGSVDARLLVFSPPN